MIPDFMSLVGYISGKLGYVRSEKLQTADGLLHVAEQDNATLLLTISGLEEQIAQMRLDYEILSEQSEQFRHASEQSARVQAGLDDALSRRGISLYQLLNEAPRINLSQIDTANKLYKALEQMPEIVVAHIRDLRTGNGSHITSISAHIAYNVLNRKVIQLPEGRIKDPIIRVFQIFKDLGIEDRLVIPQSSKV